MFNSVCFTPELTTIFLNLLIILVILPLGSIYYYSIKKPKNEIPSPRPSPRPSNTETLVSTTAAAVNNHKGKMLILKIITTIYALFLSVKKNNGIGIQGIAASIFSPGIYILTMLKSAKNFTVDHLLGKGEWTKCLSVGFPWWGWVLALLMAVPIVLILLVILIFTSISAIPF